MKTYLYSRNLRSTVWSLIFFSLLIATMARAQPKQGSASVHSVSNSVTGVPWGDLKNFYYDIDFTGGDTGYFFKFWRSNGFTNDSVILVGNVDRVYINAFKIKDAKLTEVAKAIESISEGQLNVEVVNTTTSNRGNIWTVKMADTATSNQIKTRSCALPSIFSGANPKERIEKMTDQVYHTLMESLDMMDYHGKRLWGRVQILDAEKIVVVVGTEAYVEAITGALEAAEKVAEAEKVEKSKPK